MSDTIDSLTVNYEEDGILKSKELAKEVLTRGAWTTIIFQYQDWDQKLNDYGPVKYSVRRYQKSAGEYKFRSKFNISNDKQALQIAEILTGWAKQS